MSDADWAVLDLPGVMDVARKAAASVARDYSVVFDREDAEQEAAILLATRSASVRQYVADDKLGFLYHDVRSDLVNLVARKAQRLSRQSSYEQLREDGIQIEESA